MGAEIERARIVGDVGALLDRADAQRDEYGEPGDVWSGVVSDGLRSMFAEGEL